MKRQDFLPYRPAAVLLAAFGLILGAAPAFAAAAAGDPAVLASGAAHGDDGIAKRKSKEEKEKEKEEKKKAKEGQNAKPGGKDQEKPFEEVIEDFEAHEGLFTLYTKDDKAYLEILPEQYDRTYILTLTRTGGMGGFLLGNMQVGNVPIRFHKVGKNVQLLMQNVSFRAEKDKAVRRAVEASFSDSLMANAKPASAPHEERKSDLVDLSELLITDVEGVAQTTAQAFQSPYNLDPKNSYLGDVRAFPKNVEMQAVLHFANPMTKVGFLTLVDSRSMFIRYNYSISELPKEDGFVPRLADDRIGHFVAPYADYSTDAPQDPYRRYITRWKLEKADPLLEVSEVKEPITFYVDHSVPEKYRAAIKEGIELWQSAFERIGFKNAIVAKDAPDDPDFHSSDVRYSTIRWLVAPGAAFAIGPSVANPFTGQIYDADIGFTDAMLRFRRQEYREKVAPLARFRAFAEEANYTAVNGWSEDLLRRQGPFGGLPMAISQCGIGQQRVEDLAFGYTVMLARGVAPGSPAEDAYVRAALVETTAHEVGHTLGLRHNYRGSTILSNQEIHDPARTKEVGLTGSIMEYNRVNLAPAGTPQGQYWQTKLGPYDYWAIEYAYKPIDGAERPEDELQELEKIGSRSTDPMLAYGTDQDALWFVPAPVGMDPRSHAWDMSSDPIAYYTDRMKIARELWASLPGEVLGDGEGYQIVRRAFNLGLGEYFPAIPSVTKHVGGVMHNFHHAGTPGAPPPYVPVAVGEQRRALEWLHQWVFGKDAFVFSPELVDALAVDRMGPLAGSLYLPRMDPPIHDVVLAIQDAALARLYHPVLLKRVQDMETKLGPGADHVDMAEIFGSLRDGIWSELNGGGVISSFRRNLQRRQLDYLVNLATGKIPPAPAEAVSLARYDLMQLQERIGKALAAPGADAATTAHLADSKALIERALDASFVRGA